MIAEELEAEFDPADYLVRCMSPDMAHRVVSRRRSIRSLSGAERPSRDRARKVEIALSGFGAGSAAMLAPRSPAAIFAVAIMAPEFFGQRRRARESSCVDGLSRAI